MPRFTCDVEVTYRSTVQVDAPTLRDARILAERGPAGWVESTPLGTEYMHTEVVDITRQSYAEQPYEDEMQAWRDREEMHQP